MCAKFQGQKIHKKKDIDILPTCVVGRMIFLNPWDSVILWVKFHMDVRKSFFQRHMLVEFQYFFL